MPLDAVRFPRVAKYLGALPDGLSSHPTALVKGSFVRAALEDRRIGGFVDALPEEITQLIERPPLVSTWIRSVYAQALFLAAADEHAMTDEQFGDWSYRVQKRLFGSPLYRAVAVVATPRMLLAGTRMRWGAFHRGTTIEIVDHVSRDAATVTMAYPSMLYARTNLVGFARGFQAVAELSNALVALVELGPSHATSARFDVRWRER